MCSQVQASIAKVEILHRLHITELSLFLFDAIAQKYNLHHSYKNTT